MIDRVIGNKSLPASIRHDIIERTDGIPLFVEEITKSVVEAVGEGGAERAIAAIPSSSVAVPASLHASLMARLDRLGSAKDVAQIGAVIGREFSHALVAAVARKSEAELQSALERLMAAGLLFRQGVPPHATYLFKHALVQDAAYGTLLREQRRTLHARVADTIEGQFADLAENQPELLARHCTEAGLIENAARLWGKAGQRSLERSALVEAAEQLTRALAQIAALPGTPARRREQIKLQVALANALMHTRGYAAPEPKAAIKQARLFIEDAEALGESPEDPLLLFSVLWGSWVANFVAFNADVFLDLAADFLALAEEKRASVPLMVGHHIVATSLLSTGDIAEARSHYDRAIALYNPIEHRPLATRFGQNVGVAMQSFRSLALCALGYLDAAQADNVHALREAREIGHATNLMYALSFASSTQIHCGNYATARAMADELIALADQRDALFWKAYGLLWRG
jgi:tetratricopeptide (TPR) repeat protein